MPTPVVIPLPKDFDFGWVLGFLAARTVPALEAVAENEYRRSVRLNGKPVMLALSHVTVDPDTARFRGERALVATSHPKLSDDALIAAAELVLRLRDAAAAVEGAVATVGRLSVEPGASNVIPARVVLSVDVRAPDDERVEQVAAVVPAELRRTRAVAMSPVPRAALLEQLAARGLSPVELASGAGHDAGVLAAAGVPAAMLFVRSLNGGISHSPDEHSADEDVELAVEVLIGALGRLASTGDE